MHYSIFKIESKFDHEVEFDKFKGSMIRGALGHSLKDTVCAVRVKDCSSCLLRFTCIYPSIFEPKSHLEENSTVPNRPHPYVLDTLDMNKGYYRAGEHFIFSLLLFGKVIEYFPYFLYAIESMGRNGLGRKREQGRATFILNGVKVEGENIYSSESNKLQKILPKRTLFLNHQDINSSTTSKHIRIHLLSPLRVKVGGKFASDLDFVEFIKIVLRRLRILISEFSENDWEVKESQLIQLAKSQQVLNKKIRWEEQVRYSNRQKSKLFIGGISGSFEVKGDLTPFLVYLNACEIVHLGKETSFGLGKIKIENLE